MNIWKGFLSIILVLFLSFALSCSGGDMSEKKVVYSSINDVPDKQWKKLATKKIYFAHQSVGMNIIDGIQLIMKDNPEIQISIKEISDGADFNNGMLGHSLIGKNMEPDTKLDEFKENLKTKLRGKVDVAALKFCYVDIDENTESNELFERYKSGVEELKKHYPDIEIIHFTVPLTAIQTGPKAWIKKIIGRPVGGVGSNIKRNDYNALLKAEYLGKDPVLDIAGIESTLPDGTKTVFKKDDKTYESLAPVYTTDGGHLNDIGSKNVAEQLLLLLVSLG